MAFYSINGKIEWLKLINYPNGLYVSLVYHSVSPSFSIGIIGIEVIIVHFYSRKGV